MNYIEWGTSNVALFQMSLGLFYFVQSWTSEEILHVVINDFFSTMDSNCICGATCC